MPMSANDATTGGTLIAEEAELAKVEPQVGEMREEFVSRCMSSLSSEFPNDAQRFAACSAMWERSPKQKQSGGRVICSKCGCHEFDPHTNLMTCGHSGDDMEFLSEMSEVVARFMQKQNIDLSVTDAMIREARRGISWRKEHNRGSTRVGATRATQIISNKLSAATWRRVKAFFDRHQVDRQAKGFKPGEEGYPSAGRIAWALWGGTPGWNRAKKIVSRLDAVSKSLREDALLQCWQLDNGEEFALEAVPLWMEIEKRRDEPDRGFTYVFGPVLVPESVDQQGDIISSRQIEKAAHLYMERFQRTTLLHEIEMRRSDQVVVESYLAKSTTTINGKRYPAGTWLVGMKVYKRELRKSIMSGRITGFSIGGGGQETDPDDTDEDE